MGEHPEPRLDGARRTRHPGAVDESQRWVEFGQWIVEQRERLGLRRRDAARKAKVSETTWRDLETGRKDSIGGIKLLPSLSRDMLERVAEVLELPMDEILKHVGRAPRANHLPSPATVTSVAGRRSLNEKLTRLDIRDRQLVERLVDAMLDER